MGRINRVLAIGAALGATALFAAAPALAAAPPPTSPPTATTGVASSITYQSATLSGSVKPGDESTEVYFQYGTTIGYGSQSAPTQVPAGTAAVPISVPISSLTADTVYHFRLVATNASGTSLGGDKTFGTAKIPLSLAITGAPNPVPFGGAVTIEGTLSGTGDGNAPVQLQETPFPYTAAFANIGNPELTLSNGTFAFNVLGLALNTEYRVVSGDVASAAVPVSVAVGVTLNANATGTKQHPTVKFSGTIDPAEPSARIGFERLVGTKWTLVAGTVAAPVATNGLVNFGETVHIRHGGFFRALVLSVEGSHVAGYSPTVLVKIR
jgi:hypothetical protein